MNGANKCGFTVTGVRTRYDCFLRQLRAYGIIIHNVLCQIFQVNQRGSDVEIRRSIKRTLQKKESFRMFEKELHDRCTNINKIIYHTLVPYIHLMGMDDKCISSEILPTRDFSLPLWEFFSRLIFEKPKLLFPDTLDGHYVLYIQESFASFISEQVKLREPEKKTLKDM